MPGTSVGERVRRFGIRHHGPGSARSLLAALDEWRPDSLLIEGPAELEPLLDVLIDPAVKPPVAMLVYAVDRPRQSSMYPIAEFSPEYQAIRWGKHNSVRTRFFDLPASTHLALREGERTRSDAMEDLASAAGFEEIEEWWEHLVEHRQAAGDLFQGIEELMAAARESERSARVDEAGDEEKDPEDDRTAISSEAFEAMREGHMRLRLREELASDAQRIAIVCGAWHVPALSELPSKSADEALLKGAPKLKTAATVVPWSFDRLTFHSGYGAGVRSPKFYELLWRTPASDVPTRWLLSVARLLREEDLDASPAGVIEAVRLADALSALRGRPRSGLRELCEVAQAVIARDEAAWNLIWRRLIVGEGLGEVPESVPVVPLQADLQAQQKRLRMKVDDTDRPLELDLRNDTDLARSHLLNRLGILDVPWGKREQDRAGKGTFRENWRLKWIPELAVCVIEASLWGNTVLQAAEARAAEVAKRANTLAELSALIERVLLADLEGAVQAAASKLQELSATATDVADLADSMTPLVAVIRYGSVRRTEGAMIEPVFEALFARLCIGLPGACVGLDDESAGLTSKRLSHVTAALRLLDRAELIRDWVVALRAIVAIHGCHPLVAGKASRLLFDLGDMPGEELALGLSRMASVGATARETAAYIEGLLEGSGSILIHQEALFGAVDEWLCGLNGESFDETLPLIRRTFSQFAKAERRQMGERVAHGAVQAKTVKAQIDLERAMRVVPIVRKLLGER